MVKQKSFLEYLDSKIRSGRFDLATGKIHASNPKTRMHELRHKWQKEKSKFFRPLLTFIDIFWEIVFLLAFGWFTGVNIVRLFFGVTLRLTLPFWIEGIFILFGFICALAEIDATYYTWRHYKPKRK